MRVRDYETWYGDGSPLTSPQKSRTNTHEWETWERLINFSPYNLTLKNTQFGCKALHNYGYSTVVTWILFVMLDVNLVYLLWTQAVLYVLISSPCWCVWLYLDLPSAILLPLLEVYPPLMHASLWTKVTFSLGQPNININETRIKYTQDFIYREHCRTKSSTPKRELVSDLLARPVA